MAEENAKSYLIGMKFGTRGFLGSLITNSSSKCNMAHQNAKSKKLYRKGLFAAYKHTFFYKSFLVAITNLTFRL